MSGTDYSVILRLPERAGVSYWCFKVDSLGGRPDISPERPWQDMREGDRVVAADGTVYEVDCVAPAESESHAGADVLPACQEAIERLMGRPAAFAIPR